jgi:hypothetical protein
MKKEWNKIVHVKSSIDKKDSQFVLFIGRWQSPNGVHIGHKSLFQQVLDKGERICIAIRDVEPDEKNPYTSDEVYNNITKEYNDLINEGLVKVIKICDISSVAFGRGVGYDIVEFVPPPEIAEISATKIREQLKQLHNASIG